MSWGALYGAGMGTKVFGTLQAGKEEWRRYGYDARKFRQKAEMVMKQGEYEKELGQYAQVEMVRKKGEALGSMEAGRAGAGIAFGGSASTQQRRLAARYDERNKIFGENIMFKYGQAKERYNLLLEESEEMKRRGKYAKRQVPFDIFGDLLGGYSMYKLVKE